MNLSALPPLWAQVWPAQREMEPAVWSQPPGLAFGKPAGARVCLLGTRGHLSAFTWGGVPRSDTDMGRGLGDREEVYQNEGLWEMGSKCILHLPLEGKKQDPERGLAKKPLLWESGNSSVLHSLQLARCVSLSKVLALPMAYLLKNEWVKVGHAWQQSF